MSFSAKAISPNFKLPIFAFSSLHYDFRACTSRPQEKITRKHNFDLVQICIFMASKYTN